MRKTLKFISFLILLTLIPGCLEMERHVWLNPDGSGKATVRVVIPDSARMQALAMGEANLSKQQQALDIAKEITGLSFYSDDNSYEQWHFSENSVESGTYWDNVDFGVTEDDKIYFNGTVYFKNYNEFFDDMNSMLDDIDIIGNIELITGENGEMHLVETVNEWQMEEEDNSKSETEELTEDQLQFRKSQMRSQLKQTIAMLKPYIENMNISTYYYFPGDVTDYTGFEIFDKGITYTITGSDIIKGYDAILLDDEALAQIAEKENNSIGMMIGKDFLREKLFGTKELFKASIKPQTSFDFTQETENAKAYLPELKEKLSINDEITVDENSAAAKVISSEVTAVSFVRKPALADKFKDSSYGSYNTENSAVVCVDFDTPIEKDDIEIKLVTANDNKNRSLITEDNWTYVEYQSDDKTRIAFEVDIAQPYKDTEYINGLEFKAELTYKGDPEVINAGEIVPAKDAVSQDGKIKIIDWQVRENAALLAKEQLAIPEDDREPISFARIGLELTTDLKYISDIALFNSKGKKLNAYGNCGDDIEEVRPGCFSGYLNIYEEVPDFIIIKAIGSDHFNQTSFNFSTEAFDLMGKPIEKEQNETVN
ncbi:MAG: hypothetical protein ACIAQZ_13835 [Sedimentisphaeraceae bacterium JB056]